MSIIHQFFKLNLRRLILALAVVSALTASLSSSYFYHAVQSHALIHNTLSHNLSYAIKIAEWIDVFFRATIQQLSYSATILSKHRHNLAILNQESERIFTQTDSLNYVYITNQSGEILSVYPDDKSIKLASVIRNYEQSQDGKKPLITKPYMGATGKLQVDLLYPIYLEDQCVGYIGGVILLGEKNILAQVINQNYSNDGSYPYAVDQTNRLIFNANGGMLNEDMSLNNAVRAANKEKSGSLQFVDLDGFEMLAGYARSQYTGWKVVYQRSLQETLQEANSSMLATLYYSLLFSIFGFMLIYIAAYFISKPLLQLAKNTKKHPRQSRCDKVEKIKAWYFEAAQLKCAILARTKEFKSKINTLDQVNLTDALTGLYNRRGLEVSIQQLVIQENEVSVIFLDIDYFKLVNDTYGHDTGDIVIKAIALLIQRLSRSTDIVCRYGGEEFVILLPATGLLLAAEVAERLRKQAQNLNICNNSINITISLGVSYWRPEMNKTIEDAIKLADQALYSAKQQGRNRIVVSD